MTWAVAPAAVMPGTRVRPSAVPGVNLVPGIHVLAAKKVVDGRDKPGHDGRSDSNRATIGLESVAEESGDRHVKSYLDRYECA